MTAKEVYGNSVKDQLKEAVAHRLAGLDTDKNLRLKMWNETLTLLWEGLTDQDKAYHSEEAERLTAVKRKSYCDGEYDEQ